MEVKVTIKNAAQIRQAFSKAPFTMTRELNKAIEKTVFSISRRSRVNTPVQTGRLRASTYEQFSNLKGEVGTNTDYDIFVHEGTRFMRPRPYLRDAIDETSKSIDDYFRDAVQNTLDEIGNTI